MMKDDAEHEALIATNVNAQEHFHRMESSIEKSIKVVAEFLQIHEPTTKSLSEINTRKGEGRDGIEVEADVEVFEVEEENKVVSIPIEQIVEVSPQDEIGEEKGEDQIEAVEICEEVEATPSITVEEATGLNIDLSINLSILVKCTKKFQGIVFQDVGRKIKPLLNPPMLGLDNSQPKLFPWRPKRVLWVIQGNFHRVEEEDMGRRLKPSKDPSMTTLDNSRPKLFPWRPKQLCGILKEILAGTKGEAGRRFKTSKDPPKVKLHNSRPKLFPWRPKGNSCLAFNLTPSRTVRLIFFGSSFATSSREEHTVFMPS